MRYASKKAAMLDALRAMRGVFGDAGGALAMLVAVFSLLALGWMGDAVYRLLFAGRSPWLGVLPFGLVFLLAAWLATRARARLRVDIRERQAGSARAMLMFLSPTRMADDGRRLPARDPWEMPLVAIRHHWQRGKLELVYVIASSDVGDQPGTWSMLDRFRTFISDTVGVPAAQIVNHPEDAHGVNFESAEELNAAIGRALDDLGERGVDVRDIVIDITGGQKMPAVAGGIAGLNDGLRIQYVSTRDKRPLEYDMSIKVGA